MSAEQKRFARRITKRLQEFQTSRSSAEQVNTTDLGDEIQPLPHSDPWNLNSPFEDSFNDLPANVDMDNVEMYVFDSDSELDDSDDDERRFPDIEERIFQWYKENAVTKKALSEILIILGDYFHVLPKCASTFLSKIENSKLDSRIQRVITGEYVYIGLQQAISKDRLDSCHSSTVTLKVNVDGLPLYKSSSSSLWSILVQIPELRQTPYVVAMHHGNSKPNNDEFLNDLVNEFNLLLQNGLAVGSTRVIIQKILFICDAPARSMIKCVKGHCGYFACERCEIEGEHLGHMVFDEINATLRTDERFRSQANKRHHVNVSPLEALPIDMVSDFILDYMHLICLGVIRRVIKYWLSRGPFSVKLPSWKVKDMSVRLLSYHRWIPSEFSRKARSLQEIDRYKATEFRQILMYSGVTCFSDHSSHVFQHFLLLHCATFILCSPHLSQSLCDQARLFLEQFVHESINIYGRQFCVYNVHSLLHIADDVSNNSVDLNQLSAFPFENFYTRLKRIIKSPFNPLKQILSAIGLGLLQESSEYTSSTSVKNPHFSQPCYFPLPNSYFSYQQFKVLRMPNFKISISLADSFFKDKCDCLWKVCHILRGHNNSDHGFLVHSVTAKCDLYDYPLSSSTLGIFKGEMPVCDYNSCTFVPLSAFCTKYFALPICSSNSIALFPLNM
jgi:hypothetical protein